ncbi:MAG: PQQ-binding-like beta-propeller repeat protein [bacterium]
MASVENRSGLHYSIACAVALVAVAFTVAVGMLMVSSYLAARTSSPLNLTELDRLRAAIPGDASGDAVRTRIRDLDHVARQLYFGGLHSLRTGCYLFLLGAIISLAGIKVAITLKARRPDPRGYPPAVGELELLASARFVIAATAVGLVTVAILIGIMERRRDGGEPPVRVDGAFKGEVAGSARSPAFRGFAGSGVAAFTNTPVAWDVRTGSNVLWMVKIPLAGMSSPVVWGTRVFVTGASDEKRVVYCHDLDSGTCLWQADVKVAGDTAGKVPTVNKDTGFAASTPVTDGNAVYAIFANGQVAGIDSCAREMWTIDLGLPGNKYGYSASLAMHAGKVLVQFDTGEDGRQSQLVALDSGSGRRVWTMDRPVTDSWPSPVLVETGQGTQLVTVANEYIIAYDPATGAELWRVKCGGTDVAATPICAGGLVIAAIAHDKTYAIRPDGRGDVTASHVAWTSEDGTSDVPSPVSDGELIYFAHSSGMITCVDVKTGQTVWSKGLEAEFYASPGLAGDRIYLVARSGEVFILKAGRMYEEIGRAHLGEPSDCSPAFVDGRILLRGLNHLFCIGMKLPAGDAGDRNEVTAPAGTQANGMDQGL